MKKKNSLGCLFWLALVLLTLIIFFLNRKNIETVLQKTGFKEILKKEQPAPKPKISIIKKEDKKENESEPEKTSENNNRKKTTELSIKIEESNKTIKEKEKVKYKTRKSRLFFAKVEKNGNISLAGTIRKVTYIDAPLTRTLEQLLKGPSHDEMNRGFLNLIPQGTKLKNIYVKGNTAYIDFSEDFRFNTLGIEGLKTQLKQVVYTVTEFSNIKYVQILINGKKEKYLGPEGVYIGKPLGRESFEKK